jgi:hypothetical protein
MRTNEDRIAVNSRMAEWARILASKGGVPMMLTYVLPSGDVCFLTTAGPGDGEIAHALEGAAAAIRAGELHRVDGSGPTG